MGEVDEEKEENEKSAHVCVRVCVYDVREVMNTYICMYVVTHCPRF